MTEKERRARNADDRALTDDDDFVSDTAYLSPPPPPRRTSLLLGVLKSYQLEKFPNFTNRIERLNHPLPRLPPELVKYTSGSRRNEDIILYLAIIFFQYINVKNVIPPKYTKCNTLTTIILCSYNIPFIFPSDLILFGTDYFLYAFLSVCNSM